MSLKEAVNGTTPADRILFIFLLVVSFIGIVFMTDVLPQQSDVTVEVEGKLTHRYPLHTDRRVEVRSPYGHLTLEIKDRKARVIGASCPNRLCELQGWIGQGVIICLPARIAISVGKSGETKDRKVDAITG